MRAKWVVGAAVMTGVVVSVAGCGAESSTISPSEQSADSASTATSTSQTTTTSAPTTTSSPSDSETPQTTAIGTLAPTTVSTIPDGDGSVAWTQPALLGSIDWIDMGAAAQGGRKLVHFERTGETFEEGCEGGADPAFRLVMTDFDTGQRQVLIPELGRYDQSIALGPHDRFAILAGCDANAWLAAVGTLSVDGTVEVERLPDEPDQRHVHGNNNAGVNMTWSPDGKVLYFDTQQVDAATGDPLGVANLDEPLQLRAELADGSKLVSHRGQTDSGDLFWLLSAGETMDTVPDRPALFGGQATYPAARVEVSADGQGVVVTLDRWGPDERTFLVRPETVIELRGTVTPTSDWSRALVQTRNVDAGTTRWTVVDLASGAATIPIESVPGIVYQVAWAGDETGLLMSASTDELEQDSSPQIWYTEPAQ